MSKRKHPHEGRMAQVFRQIVHDEYEWVGYTAEQPAGATWEPLMQAWVLPAVR
jgi:hypothetical protein